MSVLRVSRAVGPTDVVLRLGIVALALATGYIHSTLGGLLFTLNALGYLVAAVAMVVPLGIAIRFRWLVRLGLIGYAAVTILGWAAQGALLIPAAVAAKAIEVALTALLAVDFVRHDGSPLTVVRGELARLAALVSGRSRGVGGARA